MTIEEFMVWVGSRPFIPIGLFVAIPLVSWLVGLTHAPEKSRLAPWSYVYSTLLHIACVPGVFASVIVAYTFLIARGSLLKLDVLVTFLPVVAMVATILVVSRRTDLDRLPGFDRLWSLIGLLTLSFVVAFILDRLRIWLFFGGGMLSLLVIAGVLYIALRASARAAFGGRHTPR